MSTQLLKYLPNPCGSPCLIPPSLDSPSPPGPEPVPPEVPHHLLRSLPSVTSHQGCTCCSHGVPAPFLEHLVHLRPSWRPPACRPCPSKLLPQWEAPPPGVPCPALRPWISEGPSPSVIRSQPNVTSWETASLDAPTCRPPSHILLPSASLPSRSYGDLSRFLICSFTPQLPHIGGYAVQGRVRMGGWSRSLPPPAQAPGRPVMSLSVARDPTAGRGQSLLQSPCAPQGARQAGRAVLCSRELFPF